MLSRTAENLYWACRYIERAEMLARLIDVGYRIAITKKTSKYNNEWDSILSSSGVKEDFLEKYSEINQRNVEKYLCFDKNNMSSIVNCIIHTRENLRVIRTSITREVWDVINSAFQEIENFKPSNYRSSKLPNFLRWIIQRTSMLKGAIVSTQLTDDIYDFMNLGYYIERADNTIRILDVKYYILLSKDNKNIENNYQWETLLRSIAAYIQYRRIYGVNVDPRKICHFLIFNKSNPRSLLYCAENINNHVNNLCKYYNQKSLAYSSTSKLLAKYSDVTIDEIFKTGTHEFLLDYMKDVDSLNLSISSSYFDGGYNASKNYT